MTTCEVSQYLNEDNKFLKSSCEDYKISVGYFWPIGVVLRCLNCYGSDLLAAFVISDSLASMETEVNMLENPATYSTAHRKEAVLKELNLGQVHDSRQC